MAPPIGQGSHPKVMIAPPRLNLRRAASYQGEKAPLSSTSSRFNFNHLIFSSPPPSPGLPALVPRPRKSSSAPRPSRVLRVFIWITGLAIFVLFASSLTQGGKRIPVVGWTFEGDARYELVGHTDLPKYPTPIVLTNGHGKSKWTVSIPPTHDFPLSMKEYSSICTKCQEVAAHARELRRQSPLQQAPQDYYYEDPYFIDVRDAEKKGIFSDFEKKRATSETHDGHLVGQRNDGIADIETCRTSLTFVLETADAGLGPSLMMLWTAYGLAQKEKRAFFIEDSRWAYGKYTNIFQPSPVQNCKPPPRHQMLPCPRSAKHLVVSAATAQEIFGSSFNAEYENTKRTDINRERAIYDLARIGYEALFHLNNDDKPYVRDRVKQLKAQAVVPQGNYNDGTIIGIHVRQGDLHPFEYQYNGAYMPLDQYAQKFRDLIDERHNFSTPLGGEDIVAKQHSFMVIASDNPDVYEADEFKGAFRAQEQIKLAGKQHAEESAQHEKWVMHKFEEEAFGWEGGFFASMFKHLGHTTLHNNLEEKDDDDSKGEGEEFDSTSEDTVRLRELVGRAYVMDLAVLSEVSDSVICTMSAMGCRLLAVMMGWDKAMTRGNWVNIDGGFSWTGITV
ncbi:hypothetical protein F5B22DRAFT_420835 [Xylaria bambusicola]|uniref:uncharacterized protein n=1 Tax=Xylaria bambusicola TaxID=326684 RepID=UPI0020089F37|nr:uncharacterized protein F5B22DRAFT_420835 [Xylaria bambusicola]KAI0523854.1 hypothetical protein F5B22DRAFT_420835 [Xylaria bambusicola]